MTNPADSKTHPTWSFDYFYNSILGGELYKHAEGQGDEICHSVTEAGECWVLNHPNGKAYITDVSAGTCCTFPQHLGMILPDWMINSNATYGGVQTISGQESDVWVCDGQYTNNYACTTDSANRPVRFWEYKGDIGDETALKQWDFMQDSWCDGADGGCFDDAVFDAPEECNRLCRKA
jgi:hypothetical protein